MRGHFKSEINETVDYQLSSNNPDFLDTAFIDSLIAASGVKVKIDPMIFKTVFTAWQEHEALDWELDNMINRVQMIFIYLRVQSFIWDKTKYTLLVIQMNITVSEEVKTESSRHSCGEYVFKTCR